MSGSRRSTFTTPPHSKRGSSTVAPSDASQSTSFGITMSRAFTEGQDSEDSHPVRVPPRPKVHGCSMCPKKFDRPSTLRKVSSWPVFGPSLTTDEQHILVHTGERRPLARKSRGLADPQPAQPREYPLSEPSSGRPLSLTPPPPPTPRPKRQRRNPSPTDWVPESLQRFIRCGGHGPAPEPFPPASPRFADGKIVEDRNSAGYDELYPDVESPYSEKQWKGVLPGPSTKNIGSRHRGMSCSSEPGMGSIRFVNYFP